MTLMFFWEGDGSLASFLLKKIPGQLVEVKYIMG